MKSRIYVVALVGLAMMLVGSEAWAICYVDQNAKGKNDGSSWTNAYVHPQFALLLGCTEIWVATGVYTPSGESNDPTMSFNIPAGTKMYGGFVSGETSLDQRHPFSDFTVLSGDIDNNDDNSTDWLRRAANGIRGRNSFQIITMLGIKAAPIDSSTVLDGFIVTGGQNAGTFTDGAGISCSSEGDSIACAPTLANLALVGNFGCALRISNASGDLQVSNALFFGNHSRDASAIDFSSKGTAHVKNSAFILNASAGNGGAILAHAPVNFENVTFYFNNAFSGVGGAVYFSSDISSSYTSIFTNVTIVSNGASYGGAMYVSTGISVVLRNAIFSENYAGDITTYSSNVSISRSILQNNCPTDVACTTTIISDPKLLPLGNYGSSLPALLPEIASPAIDKGDNSVCPPVDQRGVPRTDGHCDIGAVEWRLSDDIIFRNGFQ